MGHHPLDESKLSPEERNYIDCIRRGDDFYAIDLFLRAREMYEKALIYKPGDAFARDMISKCRANVKRDTRRVIIVAAAFALAALVIILCWNYFR